METLIYSVVDSRSKAIILRSELPTSFWMFAIKLTKDIMELDKALCNDRMSENLKFYYIRYRLAVLEFTQSYIIFLLLRERLRNLMVNH